MPVVAKMVKKKDEVKPTPVEVVRQPSDKPLPLPVKHALAEPIVEKAAPVVVVKPVVKKHAKPVFSSKKAAAQPVGTHEFSFQAAKHRVWLLLEIPDGKGGRKRLREVIIRPHHSIEVTRKNAPLFVSVGNAGAIKITYGGKTLYDFGKFGPRGMVIRHRKVAVPSEQATEAASQ